MTVRSPFSTSLLTLTTALTLSTFAGALAKNLTLSSALTHASDQPGVIAARTAFQNAENDYAHAKVDPLATKVTILKARQAYELAQVNLKNASAQANAQIAQAYTQVLEAQQGVRLAQQASDLAQKAARVAEVQYEKGGGTQISAQTAANQAAAAKQTLSSARDGLNLATSNLTGLVGNFTTLSPVPAGSVPSSISKQIVEDIVSRNPTYVQLQQGAAALQLQLNLADPVAVSSSQLNTLKTQLQQTRSGAQAAQRGLRLQAQALYNTYLQAVKNRDIKHTALQNARRQYTADQSRYSKGLISQLVLLQSQVAAGQAQLASDQADDAVLTAYYNLQAGSAGSSTGNASTNSFSPAAPASAGQTGK